MSNEQGQQAGGNITNSPQIIGDGNTVIIAPPPPRRWRSPIRWATSSGASRSWTPSPPARVRRLRV
ncbi:hypothetical protein HC928_18030 [bacterium]|nr:hypothetical protein [bacterium]